jgi:Ni,Fe-hydrogenase III small subunit/ferredoxin
MPWITRGLREGIVTSHYPRRPDGYGEDFHAGVTVRPECATQGGRTGEIDTVVTACPTGAISLDRGNVSIDRGRCIVCERCVVSRPDVFISQSGIETATLSRTHLVSPARPERDEEIASTRKELAKRVRALRRSVHIRHLDCGSDGAEEWEIAALTNPIYDIQRLGVFFTASPRHADLLLVTGAGAAGMLGALALTYEAMADPKVVVAVGTDAVSGGLFANTYATRGGIGGSVAVDVFVPGSPPSPFSIMHGILLAIDLLPARRVP